MFFYNIDNWSNHTPKASNMLRLGCQGWVTTPSMESQFRSNYYFVPNKQVLEILGREIFIMYNQLHPVRSVSDESLEWVAARVQ